MISDCPSSALSIGTQVVGKEELCTGTGVFEMLAGGELGAAANLVADFGIVCSLCGNSSGSPPAYGR